MRVALMSMVGAEEERGLAVKESGQGPEKSQSLTAPRVVLADASVRRRPVKRGSAAQ
jgi:hypothetical protein